MADDGEGSVFTEGEEDNSEMDDEEQSTSEDATEESDKATGEEDLTSKNKTEGEDEAKDDLTDKGTKLDPNPLSRANQELANERAKVKLYEDTLNNPTTLKSYLSQIEGEKPLKTEEKPDEKELRYEDVKTTEQAQTFLKQQKDKIDSKIKELDSTINGVRTSEKDRVVSSRITSDIQTVREKYPELNPKNDAYNPELDQAVGALFEQFDYDGQSKKFRGNASLVTIADTIMKAAGSSKKKGSEEAQTSIRDKRTGKASSGAASTTLDTSNMSPSQIIAARIKAARGGR